jgi:hypothetical protein
MTLKNVGDRGFGVFSRVDLTKDRDVGFTLDEMTGEMLPYQPGRTCTGGEDTYHAALTIGGYREIGQPIACTRVCRRISRS